VVMIWHVLADDAVYQDLGSDWFERRPIPPSTPDASSESSRSSATASPSNPPPDRARHHRHFRGYAPTARARRAKRHRFLCRVRGPFRSSGRASSVIGLSAHRSSR
jgi:hypothetical protein